MLRGVAASMVCVFHFGVGSLNYLATLPQLQNILSFGQYGVQIFFVISGFVLPYSLYNAGYNLSSFGNFLVRRVVRIDPPYLASIVLVIILAYVSTWSPLYRGKGVDIVWSDVMLHIGYLNSLVNRPWLNPVYWTLGIEFQFYILLGLLFTLFSRSNKTVQISIVIVFLVLSLVVPQSNLIFIHAPLFFIGVFTFFYFEKFITATEFILAAIIFATVGYFSIGLVSTLFGAVAVPAILFWRKPSSLWLFLGTISYSLYLLHVPFGTRITNLIEGQTTNLYLRLTGIIVAFGFSVFVAWLCYRTIEKRSIAWSKSIASRRGKNQSET